MPPVMGEKEKLEWNVSHQYQSNSKKNECNNEQVECANSNECFLNCISGEQFACVEGICQMKTESVDEYENCDLKHGFMRVYVMDPVSFKYTFECKSLDPGIAVHDKIINHSKMCSNGKIDIDYSRRVPMPSDCVCSDDTALPIPTNGVMREYVDCSVNYHDIWKYI